MTDEATPPLFPLGAEVTYEYFAGAVSCQMNGAVIRGRGVVTTKRPDGWLVIDKRVLVRESEATRV